VGGRQRHPAAQAESSGGMAGLRATRTDAVYGDWYYSSRLAVRTYVRQQPLDISQPLNLCGLHQLLLLLLLLN